MKPVTPALLAATLSLGCPSTVASRDASAPGDAPHALDGPASDGTARDVMTPDAAPPRDLVSTDVVPPDQTARDVVAAVDAPDVARTCGASGRVCCAASPACEDGLGCQDGRCATCPAGRVGCAGACVDVGRDAANCGLCHNPCPAGARCCGGRCAPTACPPGLADCDGDCANGCEARVNVDPRNCGACGRVCAATPGMVARCEGGACAASRPCGMADCDGSAANGAETDTRSTPCHCGACGRSCLAGNGVADARCVNCECVIECHPGLADCDGDPRNGCEVVLDAFATHCGACGNRCFEGERCVEGACTYEANEALCPGSTRPIDTSVDRMNCGACGNVCPADRPTCYLGRCSARCPRFGGAMCASHPCADLNTDQAHCGACGADCPNNGRPCRGGVCGFGRSCPPGYTGCYRTCADVATDPLHCGMCGRTCPRRSLCAAGRCADPCAS